MLAVEICHFQENVGSEEVEGVVMAMKRYTYRDDGVADMCECVCVMWEGCCAGWD